MIRREFYAGATFQLHILLYILVQEVIRSNIDHENTDILP